MDAESIREAIVNPSPVRREDAIPGRTRAIIDRLVGATFSANGVAVGRVGTAILGLVAQQPPAVRKLRLAARSEEHTSELQSLMRISYAVFCLKKKKQNDTTHT